MEVVNEEEKLMEISRGLDREVQRMEGEVERMDGGLELELMINSIEGNIPTQGLYFFKLTQTKT